MPNVYLFILLYLVGDVVNSPLPVRVGIVLPHSTFNRRPYQNAIRRGLVSSDFPSRGILDFKSSNVKMALMPSNPSPISLLHILCEDFLPQNVSAILFLTNTEMYGSNSASSQYFLQLAGYLGLPMISWNADSAGFEQEYLSSDNILQLAPSIEHQATAMLDLSARYKWRQFAVVTTQTPGFRHFVRFLHEQLLELRKRNVEMSLLGEVVVNPGSPEKLRHGLASLPTEARILFLYCSREEARMVLKEAAVQGLVGANYVWIATRNVIGNMMDAPDEFPTGMLGIHFDTSTSSLIVSISRAVQLFATGLQMYTEDMNSTEITTQALKEAFYPSLSCEASNMKKWTGGSRLFKYVRQSTLPWDDGKPDIAFNEVGGLKAAELRIMNLKPGVSGTKTWEEIGVWRSWELEHELDIKGIVWPEMRHVPPEGVPEKFHLRVTFMEEPPFINMERPDPMTGKCKVNQGVICRVVGKDVNDDNDFHPNETFRCCSGYCIDLLTKFSNDLGFTYDLFRVEDGLWGAVLPNGSWNGLIAALLKNKADIVLTSLKINSARATAIDFSVPFLDTGISIVVAKRTGIISPTAFLEPFDTASWMLVAFVAIQVATFAIFFFEWLSPRGYNMKCRPPTGHRFSLLRCYWLVLAELFQASVNVDLPKGYTARFLASVWSMFAVVFIAVYTANLAAFMITREEHHELSGLHDPRIQNPFSSKPALKFGTIPHGNTDAVLRSNMPHVHHYMQRYNRSSPRTGVQALKTGELDAFVYDATALEYLVGQDDGCKVLTVGAWYAMTGYGVGFPKGSKYFSDFNKKLVEYRENGDLERLRRFWFTGACQRNKQTQSTSSPLAVEQFLSAFLLLSAGILVAVIALIFESCYFNHMRKYMMRSNVSPCITLFSVSLGHSLAPSSMGDVVRTAAHAHKNQLDLSLNKGDDMDEDVAHMQIEEVEMELAFARKRIFELEQDLIRKGLMSRGRTNDPREYQRSRSLEVKRRSHPSSRPRSVSPVPCCFRGKRKSQIASTDRANCPAEFAEFVSVV